MVTSNTNVTEDRIQVYPNPNRGGLQFSTPEEIQLLQLIDQSGQIIFIGDVKALNATSVDTGSYVLMIQLVDGSTEYHSVVIL